jgi:hypothetical protein
MPNELDRLMTITDLSEMLGVPVDTGPVRPQYDNLLLSHADRSHLAGDAGAGAGLSTASTGRPCWSAGSGGSSGSAVRLSSSSNR